MQASSREGVVMTEEKRSGDGNDVQGPATNKYRPGNVAPPREEEMQHDLLGGRIVVEETSGVAAAEAGGKLQPDPDEDPQETAGSG
jgi:hypothetical protein